MKARVSTSDFSMYIMIQKNQVTNGHLQKLNTKSDSNLCLETQLHVELAEKTVHIPRKLETQQPAITMSLLFIFQVSNQPTLHGQRFPATLFVQGIDWVLWICETDIIPFPLIEKKSEKVKLLDF